MTPIEKKEFDELCANIEKLDEEQVAREERYARSGMPGCLGTLEELRQYQDNRKILEEKLNQF